MPRQQVLGLAGSLGLLLAVIGCSPSGPDMVEVDGVVLVNDRPMSRLWVQFMPEKGPPSTAETDDQGRFKLQYRDPASNMNRPGAAVGKHRVCIMDMAAEQAPQGQEPKPGRIPSIYGDLTRSPIIKEIGPGKQNIELRIE